jgi:hypothetical protein
MSKAEEIFSIMADVEGRQKFVQNQKKGVKKDFLKQEGYPTLGEDAVIDDRVYNVCIQKWG